MSAEINLQELSQAWQKLRADGVPVMSFSFNGLPVVDFIDALIAETDALRKDAERYRDMRSLLYKQDIEIDEATLILKVTGYCPSEEEFDAAIDQARGAQ